MKKLDEDNLFEFSFLLSNCAENGELYVEHEYFYCSIKTKIEHVNMTRHEISNNTDNIKYSNIILSNKFVEYNYKYTDKKFEIKHEKDYFCIDFYDLKIICCIDENKLKKYINTFPTHFANKKDLPISTIRKHCDFSYGEDYPSENCNDNFDCYKCNNCEYIDISYDYITSKYVLSDNNKKETILLDDVTKDNAKLYTMLNNKNIENLEITCKIYNCEFKICVKNNLKNTFTYITTEEPKALNLSDNETYIHIYEKEEEYYDDDLECVDDSEAYFRPDDEDEDYGDPDAAMERAIDNMLDK